MTGKVHGPLDVDPRSIPLGIVRLLSRVYPLPR